jgi:hypothetical protein
LLRDGPKNLERNEVDSSHSENGPFSFHHFS